MRKQQIHYVTSSSFKKDENRIFTAIEVLSNGSKVSEKFEFNFLPDKIKEILEVDLVVMVQAEVVAAYSQYKVPCIVEHAGLVFEEYLREGYPGGLTKPMWNTLADNFLKETGSAGRKATARAVIAYCDGMSVTTFVGETKGTLADTPRGARSFYWDTVFIPDDFSTGLPGTQTYAEIVADPNLGLEHKMKHYSQSAKAMRKFLESLVRLGAPELWK